MPAIHSWCLRTEVANALIKAEKQLLLEYCWLEQRQAAARAATPHLVKQGTKTMLWLPSRLIPVSQNREFWSVQSRLPSPSWPCAFSLISDFREQKWVGEPGQKFSLQGIHSTNRMISVMILLWYMHFPLYCLLLFFRVFSSLLDQSHTFSSCLSDLHHSSLILLVLLLFLSLPTSRGVYLPCVLQAMDHSLWTPHPSLKLFCPFKLWALGQRCACCACPAQKTAWTLDYLHTSKLPHIFSVGARAECQFTMLEAKDVSFKPFLLEQTFALPGQRLPWRVPIHTGLGTASGFSALPPTLRAQICRVVEVNKATWPVFTFQDLMNSL